MTISGIHHIALRAHNIAATSAFYCNVLGLQECQRFYFDNQELRSIWLQLSDHTLLMIEKNHEETPASDLGFHVLAFKIEKSTRNEWLEKLKEMQIRIDKTSDYSIYFCDPDGNRLALSHFPD